MQALGLEKEMPEDGYHGADIIAIGKRLAKSLAIVMRKLMKKAMNSTVSTV